MRNIKRKFNSMVKVLKFTYNNKEIYLVNL